MPRISISLKEQELNWLNNHPWISPSGIFKDAIRRMVEMDIGYVKNDMRDEIFRRIKKLNPKFRIHVLMHDTVKQFNFGPKYPNEDLSTLIKWINEQYEKCKGMKDPERTMYFYLGKWQGMAYATVTMIKEFDGENHPIVEFESELKS
jgi:hypothetical protein